MTRSDTPSLLNLLHPRHWPVWLGMAVLWLIAHLPFSIQLKVGNALGRLSMASSARRRHIARVNLQMCFPTLDEEELEILLRKHFEALGMSLLEIAMGWWAPERRLRHMVEIHGLDYLQEALKSGKGVILLSAHFTSLEVAGRLLSLYAPFHVMYRSHQHPVIEYFMRRNRQAHFEKAIPKEDVRDMLKSLKEGKAVWYAPDQNFGHKSSIFAPFFNIPAATNTATSRLARLSGALVVPFFPMRREDGKGYVLNLLPPLENFPSNDIEQDTKRINQLIENQINLAPEQYLWVHRRFKDRPEGLKPVY